jgi:hypothetical protein
MLQLRLTTIYEPNKSYFCKTKNGRLLVLKYVYSLWTDACKESSYRFFGPTEDGYKDFKLDELEEVYEIYN